MVRIGHFVIALCILSIVVSAQDDPMAWFPFRVGNRWVYDHEWRSGDQRQPNVERWTTEESITGSVTVSEGLVLLREVKRRSDAPGQPATRRVLGVDGHLHAVQESNNADGGYVVTREREPYLVRGNCVYVMDNGFDSQSRQLRPTYKKYIAEGAVSPDFCFPLETGRSWGNTDIPWRVEPVRKDAGALSPVEYAGAIHIVSDHFGSGGWKEVWFEKGVGVVGEHYIHSGSYEEYTKKLLSSSR